MLFETISLTTDDRGVALLTLDRPDRKNALSGQMCDELTEAARLINADPGVRLAVLTGAGRIFCAGADLAWMRAQFEATRAQRIAEARRLASMLFTLNTLEKPLIGRVTGAAYGGGVGLMAVCDAVVASADARFALTETRLGLIPATISPYVIGKIGEGRARPLFASARLFDAEEGRLIGLCTRVEHPEAIDQAVEAEVFPYFATAPAAVTAAKRLARDLGPRIDAEIIEMTIKRLADTWETPEALAGIEAFLEKRPAPWSPPG